jgi:hypothetical protein
VRGAESRWGKIDCRLPIAEPQPEARSGTPRDLRPEAVPPEARSGTPHRPDAARLEGGSLLRWERVGMEYREDQFGDGIDYRGAGPAFSWAVVETFATVGQWHAAKGILAKNGIAGQMRSTDDPDGGYDLLVLETELEWARELLASGGESFEKMTHGFPINPDTPRGGMKGAQESESSRWNAMSGLPVESEDLTPDQQLQYNTIIWLLWGLLVFVVLLIVLGFIL